MVNLHIKQRALERLRYRPGHAGAYLPATYAVPDGGLRRALEPGRAGVPVWRALQMAPRREDVPNPNVPNPNVPNPNVAAPAFDQPHIFIDNSTERRRAQAKAAWAVFLVGLAALILIFLDAVGWMVFAVWLVALVMLVTYSLVSAWRAR